MVTRNRYNLAEDMAYQGTSLDSKPTDGVAVNSIFWELDTNFQYYFDGSAWQKVGGDSDNQGE